MAAPDHTPSLVQKLKQRLVPLQRTPLHPQWLLRGSLTSDDLHEVQGLTLDVGCAGGDTRQLLAEAVQYIGLDHYATATGWYGTTPEVFGDGQCLPFADASLQSVLMLHVLEHLRRPEQAIAEAWRTLALGKLLLKWLERRSLWLSIAPLLLLLVPLINLIGWALSHFEQSSSFMPHRVRAFARKPEAG